MSCVSGSVKIARVVLLASRAAKIGRVVEVIVLKRHGRRHQKFENLKKDLFCVVWYILLSTPKSVRINSFDTKEVLAAAAGQSQPVLHRRARCTTMNA